MLKKLELTDPNSCLNKSEDDEPIFVLCARDELAPELIFQWIDARIVLGKNKEDDEKIKEAKNLAFNMIKWRRRKIELDREKMFINAGMTWKLQDGKWTASIEKKLENNTIVYAGNSSISLYEAQENCWRIFILNYKES